jgi:hypothetical protein
MMQPTYASSSSSSGRERPAKGSGACENPGAALLCGRSRGILGSNPKKDIVVQLDESKVVHQRVVIWILPVGCSNRIRLGESVWLCSFVELVNGLWSESIMVIPNFQTYRNNFKRQGRNKELEIQCESEMSQLCSAGEREWRRKTKMKIDDACIAWWGSNAAQRGSFSLFAV